MFPHRSHGAERCTTQQHGKKRWSSWMRSNSKVRTQTCGSRTGPSRSPFLVAALCAARRCPRRHDSSRGVASHREETATLTEIGSSRIGHALELLSIAAVGPLVPDCAACTRCPRCLGSPPVACPPGLAPSTPTAISVRLRPLPRREHSVDSTNSSHPEGSCTHRRNLRLLDRRAATAGTRTGPRRFRTGLLLRKRNAGVKKMARSSGGQSFR